MDPAKHSCARETLSKEGSDIGPGNRGSQDFKDDASSKHRFYECTFCKRGFTNAQALGGHMNIHRKDRVKPSHKIKAQPPSRDGATAACDHTDCRKHQHGAQPYYCYSIAKSQRNYQKGVLASPATLLRHQANYLQSFDFEIPSSAGLSRGCGFAGVNLSLNIGRSSKEVSHVLRTDEDNEEIDLELRLGRSCS